MRCFFLIVDYFNDVVIDATRVKAFCRFDLAEMDLIAITFLASSTENTKLTSTLPPYLLKSRPEFPSSSDCGRTIVLALLARGNYLAVVRANHRESLMGYYASSMINHPFLFLRIFPSAFPSVRFLGQPVASAFLTSNLEI